MLSLPTPERPTWIVDVGSLPIDGKPSYWPLIESGHYKAIGFDPQMDRFDCAANGLVLSTAVIGDGDQATLRICKAPGMTSLFELDGCARSMFLGFQEWAQIEEIRPVTTCRLDDIDIVERIDFLKIDVQGAELMVLNGAAEKLSQAVVVQTEVQFVSLYKDAPLFADIDLTMRQLGFRLHRFYRLTHRPLYPINGMIIGSASQVFDADAVYVRSLDNLSALSGDQLQQLAVIMSKCYMSIDLSQACLREIATKEQDKCL